VITGLNSTLRILLRMHSYFGTLGLAGVASSFCDLSADDVWLAVEEKANKVHLSRTTLLNIFMKIVCSWTGSLMEEAVTLGWVGIEVNN
jgi:hypothetical protein